jgi:chromosomal replication initiator protein
MIANYTIKRANVTYVQPKLTGLATTDFILDLCAKSFHITVDQLRSNSRKKEYTDARHIARWFVYFYTDKSLLLTSICTGGKEHSVVYNAHEKVKNFLFTEPYFKKRFDAIKDEIEKNVEPVKSINYTCY